MTSRGSKALGVLLAGVSPMRVDDVLAALETTGCTVEKTKKGHYKVRREGYPGPQVIAVGHDGVVKKCYLSRLRTQLGLADETD